MCPISLTIQNRPYLHYHPIFEMAKKSAAKAAPAAAPKAAAKVTKAAKVANPLFPKRPKNFRVGGDVRVC